MKRRIPRPAWFCAVYFILHVLAHVSAAWFEIMPGISIWYPPCGLAVSLLVLLGPRYAPVVLAANLVTALPSSVFPAWWAPLLFPALITAHYTATAWLVRRFLGTRLLPGGPRGTVIFWLTVLGSPAVLALAGSAVSLLAGPRSPAELLHAAFYWWIGDASGLLTVVPITMVFAAPWLTGAPAPMRLGGWRPIPTLLLLGRILALVGSLGLVFAIQPLRESNAFYICFLPLIWICLAHGLPGATLATLAITMGGLVGLRLTGSTLGFANIFLLFELAVAAVGLGLGLSVSRRNEVERKLAANEARLDRVIAGAQLGLWDWNVPGRQIDTNHRMAEMLGYRPNELTPFMEHWLKLVHPADSARVQQALDEHFANRSPLYEAEYRMRAKDERWRWIHSRGSVVLRDDEQRPVHFSGTHSDVTDRKLAEAETRRLLNIFEATPDFILMTDEQGRLLYANGALLSLCGQPDDGDWHGRHLNEIFPGETGRVMAQSVIPAVLAAGTGTWHGEITLTDRHGHEIPASQVVLAYRDEETETTTLSFIMRDISRQKRAEAESIEKEREMLLLQKAESLGVLAGGIAHDFNNLLTAMLGNANLARLDLQPNSAAHQYMGQIELAAKRAAGLCQQMLAFAGRSPLTFADVDLNQLIEDSNRLLKASLCQRITIDFQGEPALRPVLAAASQIQQVVMNLAINATEAIGDKDGIIAIRTRHCEYSAAELDKLFPGYPLTPGAHVLLEVSDTGCGMPPEVLARIFEPFFTTKHTGHGLGLAAVIGIIKSHGGAIRVQSAPGKGTTFQVVFPAHDTRLPAKAPVRDMIADYVGSGLVLVVEDEPEIRDVTARLLKRIGFTPLLAADGVEGVAAFRQHAGELRLVLLDLVMPRMDGSEALAEMRRLNPTVPVILMSGFSQKLTLDDFSTTRPAGVMTKPFDYETLRARLESVLTLPS